MSMCVALAILHFQLAALIALVGKEQKQKTDGDERLALLAACASA